MNQALAPLLSVEQIVLTFGILLCAIVVIRFRPRTAGAIPRGERGAGIVVCSVVGLVAIFLFARGGDPIGVRADSWSDANIVVSGRNYALRGLFADYGAAQHQIVMPDHPPDPFFLYTQYPVGSNLINGMLQIAGITAHRAFRVLPALCSLAALLAWWRLFRRFAGATVGAAAAVAMATSYGFLGYADALHFHAYAQLAAAGALLCFIRAMNPAEARRPRWLAATAGLFFVVACFTWEYHLWLMVFVGLYGFLFAAPIRLPGRLLLAIPLFVGLGLQIAQRRAAFDHFPERTAAAHDTHGGFMDDVYRRTIGFASAVDTPEGLTPARYPAWVLLRFFNFYGLPLLAAGVLLAAALWDNGTAPWRPGTWSDGGRFAVLLTVAGIAWWCIMMQHTSVHAHVMRQALPAYCLLVALVMVRCARTVVARSCGAPARLAAGALMALVLYPHVEGLVTDLRLHLVDNYIDHRERSDGGLIESQRFRAIGRAIPPGAVVLTNHKRLPLLRMWIDRPVYNGKTFRFPPDKPAIGRVVLELRWNHIRELYGDHLPPLYYVYHLRENSIERQFAADALLRLLLTGRTDGGAAAWEGIAGSLAPMERTGRAAGTFCPIVARTGRLLCFDINPLAPILHATYDSHGFPSLDQFGPPR